MQPTHRHADGGLYRLFATSIAGKDSFGEWEDGVLYQCIVDGKTRWTTAERWKDRFEQIEWDRGSQNGIMQDVRDDEDNLIASFTFETKDAGDLRHMLIRHGHGAGKRPTRQEADWLRTVLETMAEQVTKGLHVRDHSFPDLIGDVAAFHAKFGQEYVGKPRLLPADLHDFRTKFHDEETGEYRDEYPKLVEAIERQDRRDIVNTLELQLDALCDAAWVILGTADLQFGRAVFYEAWRRVVKANMAKVLATDDPKAQDSGREVKYDIRKPAGWEAPDHRDLVSDNAIFDDIFGFKGLECEHLYEGGVCIKCGAAE